MHIGLASWWCIFPVDVAEDGAGVIPATVPSGAGKSFRVASGGSGSRGRGLGTDPMCCVVQVQVSDTGWVVKMQS